MEFSEFFIFASFGIVRFSKIRNFWEQPSFSEFAKISQKKFGNKFKSKPPVFVSKKPVFEAKTGVSEYSEFMEYSELFLFRIFQKLQKMTSKSSLVCRALVFGSSSQG